MTPKQKAKELVMLYSKKSNNLKQRTDWNYDKQCALIAVNEIVNSDWFFEKLEANRKHTKYWYDVQDEINNL